MRMTNVMIAHAAAMCAVAFSSSAQAQGKAPGSATPIPLVVGLTVTSSVRAVEGDYDALANVTGTDARNVSLTIEADAPQSPGGPPQEVSISRTVQMVDLKEGRTMKYFFTSADPDVIAGSTAIEVSAAVLEDLRKTGTSQITLDGRAGGLFGAVGDLLASAGKASGVGRLLDSRMQASGTVSLVEKTTIRFAVLVNGKIASLPVYHVRGHLGNEDNSEDAELFILDDVANPLVLREAINGEASEVTKIEFPAANASTVLEQELAKDRRSVLYGIYFDFNSATLKPQSEPVLREIVAVMKREPAWTLKVEGHTDNVGGDAKNLDLSTRRAAAVKAALVERGVLANRLNTGGYGSQVPRETNTTLAGRARNRRVELSRE
jgi:outer membrane protein OmpA-like peptidoglycan-associated protein